MSGIRKTGDWGRASQVVGELAYDCVQVRDKSLKQLGLKAEGIAKKHMSNQDLGWDALKPSTVATKIRKGLSEKTLIATSSYFQAITTWQTGQHCLIGVRRGTRDKDGNVIADIAKIHEFGAVGIVARPLWQPTMDEAIAWHTKFNDPAMLMRKMLKQKYGI